jgi:hypothetical protein
MRTKGIADRPVFRGFCGTVWGALFCSYIVTIQDQLDDETYRWAPGEHASTVALLTNMYEASRDGSPATLDADVTAMREMLEHVVEQLTDA